MSTREERYSNFSYMDVNTGEYYYPDGIVSVWANKDPSIIFDRIYYLAGSPDEIIGYVNAETGGDYAIDYDNAFTYETYATDEKFADEIKYYNAHIIGATKHSILDSGSKMSDIIRIEDPTYTEMTFNDQIAKKRRGVSKRVRGKKATNDLESRLLKLEEGKELDVSKLKEDGTGAKAIKIAPNTKKFYSPRLAIVSDDIDNYKLAISMLRHPEDFTPDVDYIEMLAEGYSHNPAYFDDFPPVSLGREDYVEEEDIIESDASDIIGYVNPAEKPTMAAPIYTATQRTQLAKRGITIKRNYDTTPVAVPVFTTRDSSVPPSASYTVPSLTVDQSKIRAPSPKPIVPSAKPKVPIARSPTVSAPKVPAPRPAVSAPKVPAVPAAKSPAPRPTVSVPKVPVSTPKAPTVSVPKVPVSVPKRPVVPVVKSPLPIASARPAAPKVPAVRPPVVNRVLPVLSADD